MRVLGVDPGSLTTGWGLVEDERGASTLVDCGVIRLSRSGGTLAVRLGRLQRELGEIVARLRPTCAAVESPFHGANARSALQLAHARGVILAVLATAGLEVGEYSPATVKKSVTGNGRAPKDQVQTMVTHLLGRRAAGETSDLADAIAVALCHASTRCYLSRLERSKAGTNAKPGRRASVPSDR